MFTSLTASKALNATRSFRTSAIAAAAQKNTIKPSIGDAVTILQSKVSGINQVVSSFSSPLKCFHKSEFLA